MVAAMTCPSILPTCEVIAFSLVLLESLPLLQATSHLEASLTSFSSSTTFEVVYFVYIIIHLTDFNFLGNRELERHLLFIDLFPKCLRWSLQSQANAGSLELNPGSTCGQQGPEYLNHHLLPAQVHRSRKLKSATEPGLEFRHSGVGISSGNLLSAPNVLTFLSDYSHSVDLSIFYLLPRWCKSLGTLIKKSSWKMESKDKFILMQNWVLKPMHRFLNSLLFSWIFEDLTYAWILNLFDTKISLSLCFIVHELFEVPSLMSFKHSFTYPIYQRITHMYVSERDREIKSNQRDFSSSGLPDATTARCSWS